jgi:hypothetical protein
LKEAGSNDPIGKTAGRAPSGSGMRLERALATRIGLRFPAPDEWAGRRSFLVDA